MQRPNSHSPFFSSLKQVEKRLKLDTNQSTPTTSSPTPPRSPQLPPPENQENTFTTTQQTDSLGSPIFLNYEQHFSTNANTSSILQESEAPQEFLSSSPAFPPNHESPHHENHVGIHENAESSNLGDDIELLMQLLGLSDSDQEPDKSSGLSSVGCDDEFYKKIVGVKGPKSGKEVERLDGWINHLLNGDEAKEPFRLAHLLLGKAAILHSGHGDFGGFEFPSTIDEFLENDPPPCD